MQLDIVTFLHVSYATEGKRPCPHAHACTAEQDREKWCSGAPANGEGDSPSNRKKQGAKVSVGPAHSPQSSHRRRM